VVIQIELKDR
jgi:hypothetical protein